MIQVFVIQAIRPDFRLPEHQCQVVPEACLKFQPQKVETVIPEARWLVRLATLLSSEVQCRILLQRIKWKNNGRFLHQPRTSTCTCVPKCQHAYACMYTPHIEIHKKRKCGGKTFGKDKVLLKRGPPILSNFT